MSLKLSSQALKIIQEHLEAGYPNEACGFFYGKIIDKNRLVQEVRPVENAKQGDQRRRFEIAPLDYMRAELYALETGLTLLGIYHSHPEHPAVPSAHDLKQAVPVFSYIIATIQGGKLTTIRSWLLEEDQGAFREEELLVEKAPVVSE